MTDPTAPPEAFDLLETAAPPVLTRERLAVAWRQSRRAVFIVVAACTIAGILAAAWANRRWRADSAFLPQTTTGMPTGIASLAAEFGISAPMSSAGESPAFYVALIRSRELLREALRAPIRPDSAGSIARDSAGADTLAETWFSQFAPADGSSRQREDAAIEQLKRRVALNADERTGLVHVAVRMGSPEEAEALNRRILDLVNDFNLRRRRTRAAAERAFVDERLAEAGRELRNTENALRQFSESNSSVERSPRLQLEQGRLLRRVELAQQLYVTLAQAREQAYLEEVRTTPVVTIVDRPEGAAYRRRGLFAGAVAGCVLGGLLGAGMLVWRSTGLV